MKCTIRDSKLGIFKNSEEGVELLGMLGFELDSIWQFINELQYIEILEILGMRRLPESEKNGIIRRGYINAMEGEMSSLLHHQKLDKICRVGQRYLLETKYHSLQVSQATFSSFYKFLVAITIHQHNSHVEHRRRHLRGSFEQ